MLRDALPGYEGDILYAEHHESHAASAFFPSPFDEAAILTIDGVGEWATSACAMGRGNDFEILRELHWPDSLGLLYSAFTYFTGFKVNSGEYKVMGLAPYGEPKYVDLISRGARRSPRGRLVHAEPEVLQLPERADHDERRVRAPVRWRTPRTGVEADAARDGSRALGSGRVRGDHAADGSLAAPRHRREESLPRRRRRAELRGQRPSAPRGPVRATLDSACRWRCRRRTRRRPVDLASPLRRAAQRERQQRRHAGRVSRTGILARPDRRVPRGAGRVVRATRRRPPCSSASRRCSATRRSSGGSMGGWSSDHAPSARAAFSATRAARACRRR